MAVVALASCSTVVDKTPELIAGDVSAELTRLPDLEGADSGTPDPDLPAVDLPPDTAPDLTLDAPQPPADIVPDIPAPFKPTGLHHGQAFDFDGDGESDIGTYYPVGGKWSLRLSKDGSEWAHEFGWREAVPVPGDYDGDGMPDIAVYFQKGGDWYVRKSADGQMLTPDPVSFGGWPWAPVPGDYDGDGATDMAIYRPETRQWKIRQSSDGQVMGGGAKEFGPKRSFPVPGDYDGDGVTDLAVLKLPDSNWHILLSSTGEKLTDGDNDFLQFGWGETVPVQGDYDGDGSTDLAVYHPAKADWYVLQSSGGMLEGGAINFGPKNSMPVPGDYDGDGKTDLAAYKYKKQSWHIRQSSDGKLLNGGGLAWGAPESTPISALQKGIVWKAELDLPATPGTDGIDNHLQGNEQNTIPVSLTYDNDWVIQAWMTGLTGSHGQRYFTYDKGSFLDIFPWGNDPILFRLYNRKIWFLKNPVLGGGHALYPSFKVYTGEYKDNGDPVYICDEDLTEGELCNSDHVASVVEGKNYTSGSHALRMEYIRSRSRSGAADEGVFRVYWDGELVGDWNTWEEELPPAMWKLYVGRMTGGKFRYYQGRYQSVIGE